MGESEGETVLRAKIMKQESGKENIYIYISFSGHINQRFGNY